jgi:hypothetical protein
MRDAHAKLLEGLATAGSERAPRGDWEARVWAEIARAPQRRSWAWLWTASLAGAAVLLIFAMVWRPLPIALEVDVRPGLEALRGKTPHPGDVMMVHASTGRAHHAELRVYRDDRDLVLRKAGGGRHIDAELQLQAIGSYRTLLLISDHDLPAETLSLDEDARRVVASGGTVKVSLPFEVW